MLLGGGSTGSRDDVQRKSYDSNDDLDSVAQDARRHNCGGVESFYDAGSSDSVYSADVGQKLPGSSDDNSDPSRSQIYKSRPVESFYKPGSVAPESVVSPVTSFYSKGGTVATATAAAREDCGNDEASDEGYDGHENYRSKLNSTTISSESYVGENLRVAVPSEANRGPRFGGVDPDGERVEAFEQRCMGVGRGRGTHGSKKTIDLSMRSEPEAVGCDSPGKVDPRDRFRTVYSTPVPASSSKLQSRTRSGRSRPRGIDPDADRPKNDGLNRKQSTTPSSSQPPRQRDRSSNARETQSLKPSGMNHPRHHEKSDTRLSRRSRSRGKPASRSRSQRRKSLSEPPEEKKRLPSLGRKHRSKSRDKVGLGSGSPEEQQPGVDYVGRTSNGVAGNRKKPKEKRAASSRRKKIALEDHSQSDKKPSKSRGRSLSRLKGLLKPADSPTPNEDCQSRPSSRRSRSNASAKSYRSEKSTASEKSTTLKNPFRRKKKVPLSPNDDGVLDGDGAVSPGARSLRSSTSFGDLSSRSATSVISGASEVSDIQDRVVVGRQVRNTRTSGGDEAEEPTKSRVKQISRKMSSVTGKVRGKFGSTKTSSTQF